MFLSRCVFKAYDVSRVCALLLYDASCSFPTRTRFREQHQFNQLLRQQQEEAFEESLRTDRERDQQKRAEAARKQAEEQERLQHALAKERKAQVLPEEFF